MWCHGEERSRQMQNKVQNCSKTVLKLQQQHKNLSSPRGEDWEGHLQAVQDLLPILCESGSINYLRYGSFVVQQMSSTLSLFG